MNRIHRIDPLVVPILDNPDLVYANRHRVESGFGIKGIVTCDHYRNDNLIHTQTGYNTFTTEGMARLLNIIFGDQSKAGSAIFYVGIFKNNVVPAVGDTAAAKLGTGKTYGECQDADYTPNTNKPAYTIATTTTASCTNAASAATFTIVVASMTVYGAFLSTVADKTASTGYLFAAKAFTTPRAVITADVLAVTYVVAATTS
jgi:hypothetical protein